VFVRRELEEIVDTLRGGAYQRLARLQHGGVLSAANQGAHDNARRKRDAGGGQRIFFNVRPEFLQALIGRGAGFMLGMLSRLGSFDSGVAHPVLGAICGFRDTLDGVMRHYGNSIRGGAARLRGCLTVTSRGQFL
jgi:hypothetical protein